MLATTQNRTQWQMDNCPRSHCPDTPAWKKPNFFRHQINTVERVGGSKAAPPTLWMLTTTRQEKKPNQNKFHSHGWIRQTQKAIHSDVRGENLLLAEHLRSAYVCINILFEMKSPFFSGLLIFQKVCPIRMNVGWRFFLALPSHNSICRRASCLGLLRLSSSVRKQLFSEKIWFRRLLMLM